MFPNKQIALPLIFIAVMAFFNSTMLQAQENELCGVQVVDVKASTLLGHLVGYTVKFENTKQQTVDHLIWKVDFEDNSGTIIETTQGVFNSTDLISPIQPGKSKRFVRTPPKIKGASRAQITITRVHTIQDETCTLD